MAANLAMMHHVVFTVGPERLSAPTTFLEALGFRFQTHALDDVGLLVTLDWQRGVELVIPLAGSDMNPGLVADFIARHGDGVYSAVVRVAEADAAAALAARHGADAEFRPGPRWQWARTVEVQLSAVFGMPLTLLSTNLSCWPFPNN
jgi:4-hydroxyphenylpyruvate dioxygenase-like putative hemolysin